MGNHHLRSRVQSLLDRAGISLDGPRPFDPQIHDARFFARVLAKGSLGLGESYMDGWWDCLRLDEFIRRIKRAGLAREVRNHPPLWSILVARFRNLQSPGRAFQIGERHYDLGNDLYRAMLGPRMIYTGALWRDAGDLDTAQERKLEWVARKLQLEPGQRVLDIGCGWGGTARYLAEEHGVEVTGITVSRQQQEYGEQLCRGLPVRIRLLDYRDLDEKFDRILSLGMIEHVGEKNYGTYFDVVRRCLAPEGLFVLQTIGTVGGNPGPDPWIERYIFPNSVVPSAAWLAEASAGRLVMEDWENIGVHYDRTLMAWYENFEQAWPRLRDRYGERFRRMWRFYLLACAGSFRARAIHLWQIVFSREGMQAGYERPHATGRRLEMAMADRA